MRVLVCGSRGWEDGERVYARLDQLAEWSAGYDEQLEIIEGGAAGADRWARKWALANGVRCVSCPAEWERYGRGAGFIRNVEMLERKPDLVIAFWDGSSPGTGHTVGEARKRTIPVEVIHG